MSRILCLVAGQRTGTTALKSALVATGKFHNFSEIFQTGNAARQAGSFLEFARSNNLGIDRMATYEDAQQIAVDYVHHLQELAAGRIPLIDVKLNSWNVIRPFWSYPHQEPIFLRVLKALEAYFVFVLRRDLTGQILSEHIARSATKWHNLESKDIDKPLDVNVGQVRRQAQMIVQAENLLYAYLKNYKAKSTCTYENLFVDGGINPDLVSALALGLSTELGSQLQPLVKKNQGAKENVIANYREVESAVRAVEKTCGRAF